MAEGLSGGRSEGLRPKCSKAPPGCADRALKKMWFVVPLRGAGPDKPDYYEPDENPPEGELAAEKRTHRGSR